MLTSPTQRMLVLKVGETVFDAVLDDVRRIGRARTASAPEASSRSPACTPINGDRPPSFRLFLRSADDVSVFRRRPWWTLRHTAVMVVDARARRRRVPASGCSDDVEPEAAAVPGGAQRAQPRRARAARHAGAGARRNLAAARGGGRQPARPRRTRRASRSTSRGRCCATARRKRADRSWICARRRSRAATSPGRSRISRVR